MDEKELKPEELESVGGGAAGLSTADQLAQPQAGSLFGRKTELEEKFGEIGGRATC